MRVSRYTDEHNEQWNTFVAQAKNSHFFFSREYMEYHSDRFSDFSLMVFDESEKLIAILAANRAGNTVYSHQGLTFGGFLTGNKMKTQVMLEVFERLKEYLIREGITRLIYKCIPYIYHQKPAEEDRYALFVNGAQLASREVSTTLDLGNKIKFQDRRKRAVKKAKKNSLVFEESSDYKAYWAVLDDVLSKQHDATPVHSLAEIELLASRFPDNIRLFVARKDDRVLGGTVIFESAQIVHTQYLANSDEGREVGALDFVIDRLINDVYKDKRYFDFGISNEDSGRVLNTGLISQKEGFGARAVVHDVYEWELA